MPLQQDSEQESYEPFDPATVRPSIDAPPSDVPLGVSDAHEGTDVSGAEVRFDDRHTEDFQGLLYLGALTKRFTWLGHTFAIRTLTTDELLMVGQMVKEYEGTISQSRAYTTAMVAMAVQTVDGVPLPRPYKDGPDLMFLEDRFKYVARNWFPYTIDYIYNEYLSLEARVREVLTKMGEASGQTV